ncbi:flagellar filament capping protein FliD [Pseudoduganella albidiflava]|uniref:Flagellar hook-associated protein 2 n=1 Tax=Pseudoduganella albidiflava TaxID=321983 RepID=A0A411WWF1_9BURK|nr:flagellar filament capping protein FliD [Pseudoduganella albidiflava]QBI01076.1 lateral flagellar hook-associated protein 2 [Pseudoduganella albidiflava]GGY47924.1 flagellar hook-associated protein 2 [Pseudoduganella albidiflava]
MATTAPTYDPKSTATQLATLSIQARQSILTTQNDVATATDKALTSLKSAMSTFEGAMSTLSMKKTVLATSATFSSPVGTATAGISATAGTYSFYVEQLATANQAQYSNLSDTTPMSETGTINISVGGTTFPVDLTQADTSGDGVLSIKELATAINGAAGNTSKVTASTMTIGGVQQLVLASTETGAANTVSIDGSGLPAGALQDALADPANRTDLTVARDAVIYLGEQGTGTRIEQPSNTFTVVDGVSMTFTKAQAPGESPVSLTVATDTAATTANLQGFVDGWNKLVTTLKSLTDAGSVKDGTSAGVFHADAGLQALQTRMQSVLRQQSGGLSMVNFGITGNRDGTLSLDSGRLTKALAANPGALDQIMGNNGIGTQSGVMGELDKLLGGWTDITSGQISKRSDVNSQLQESLLERQSRLDTQYESAYIRYLNQFTTLQTLQAQMDSNTSMFDAMFSNDD